MNPEENPPRKLKRVAYFGRKDEVAIYYTCFETKADGEVDVTVDKYMWSSPDAANHIIYPQWLGEIIEASGGTWEQAIANAPLVTDEDGEIIRRN